MRASPAILIFSIVLALGAGCGGRVDPTRVVGDHASPRASTATPLGASSPEAAFATSSLAPTSALADGVIVIPYDPDGNGPLRTTLHVIPAAGGEPRRFLSDNDASVEDQGSPAWSPDGSMLAFGGSTESGAHDLFVVDADGANLRNITNSADWEEAPFSWSPDGSRIVFAVADPNGPWIGVARTDGSGVERIADGFYHPWGPAWSPDGEWIAFSAGEGHRRHVHLIRPDGSDLHELAGVPHSGAPRWSPDGSRLAFDAANGFELYLVDRDGSNLRRLAEQGIYGSEPIWSPDGRAIAYISTVADDVRELFIMDGNGTNPRQLTHGAANPFFHSWTPDGGAVVYLTELRSRVSPVYRRELRVTTRDGQDRVIFSATSTALMEPAWRPAGARAEARPVPTWPPVTATVSVVTPTPWSAYGSPTPASGLPAAPERWWCDHSGPFVPPGLFVMNADGSDVRELLPVGAAFLQPSSVAWTPDGRYVTVAGQVDRWRHLSDGIYQIDPSSGELTRLIEMPGAASPAWSPDGSQLAFTRLRDDGQLDLLVANADGSEVREIALIPGEQAALRFAADGIQVAYVVNPGGDSQQSDIWYMRGDGSGAINLTDSPSRDVAPFWLPDGSIGYLVESVGQYRAVRPDGSGRRVLSVLDHTFHDPDWSPDGSQVAYASEAEIWIAAADGANPRNMTQHPGQDRAPRWSPDGARLTFLSFRTPEVIVEARAGTPRPMVLRSGPEEQVGGEGIACWISGNSRSVGGQPAVTFAAEPLPVEHDMVTLDVTPLGTPTAIAVTIYDYAATAANGKIIDGIGIVLPCAAPGRTEDECRVAELLPVPEQVIDLALDLPPGEYVLVVAAEVQSAGGFGFVEQGFHIEVVDGGR
jgi:Tol biopolymer transport system component